jgi:predicted RNase H-like HicB family nuclease
MTLTWSKADNAWLVEAPELPGAMADGATPAEAVNNVLVIIDEWLAVAREEGRAIPQPHEIATSA